MRYLLRVALAGLLCIAGGQQVLNAQLAPGELVRVRHATACCGVTTTSGGFIELTPSVLLLSAPRSGLTITVPRDSIRGLERAVVGDNHIYLGTTIGLVGGAVAGYFVGSSHPACKAEEPCLGFLVGLGGAFVGSLAGGVVGWLVGSQIRRTEWEPVDLPVRVGVEGGTRQVGIAIAVRY